MQSHPEFDGFIMDNVLDMRHEQKIFGDELYGSGKARAGRGITMAFPAAAAFWRFLLDGQCISPPQMEWIDS